MMNLFLILLSLYINFAFFLVICQSIEQQSMFSFLNKSYTLKQWTLIKSTIDCISTNGEWIDNGKHSGMIYHQPCMWNRYVEGACQLETLMQSMKGLDYMWIPKKECFNTYVDLPKIKWNRDRMCGLLNNHQILLLGDSLQDEWFYSITSALLDSNVTMSDPNASYSYACGTNPKFKVAYSGSGGTVSYRRMNISPFNCNSNAILTNIRHDHFFISNYNERYNRTIHAQEELFGAGWHYLLNTDLKHTDLLIANRGAHYVPDHIVIHELNHTLFYLAKKHPTMSIIFRSTAPGHTNYKTARYEAPLRSESEALMGQYSWDQFNKQNKLVKKLLDSHYPYVLFLDVYPSTVLRHDAHTDSDGLHYCMPGPIDNWTILLYNLLDLLDRVIKE